MTILEAPFHGTVDLDLDLRESDFDFTCERFLRGFQSRSKSLRSLQSYILWRTSTATVSVSDISESLRAKKVFVLQETLHGGWCVMIIARKHGEQQLETLSLPRSVLTPTSFLPTFLKT